jgi:hypothetical protein
MAKLDPDTLKHIYATKVKPQEILSLVQEMTRLHQEGEEPDFYTAVAILAERNKEGSVRRRANKMFAITERMQCLAKLVEEQDVRMRGWTMNAIEVGCVLTTQPSLQPRLSARSSESTMKRSLTKMSFSTSF